MQQFIPSLSQTFYGIPKKGVYALKDVRDGLAVIVYVGQSNNIPRRILEHYNAEKIPFSSFSWIPVDDPKKRSATERYWINKLQPEYNIRMNYARK